MRKIHFILILGLLLLVGCAQTTEAPPAIEVAVDEVAAAPTETPPPTPTAIPPSDTPAPTATPVPTETPIPPTETALPTATLAPTLTPYTGPARIVFSSNRGADPTQLGLYIMEVESREITAIETGLDVHLYPKWSPDGNRILFSVPDVWHLYIVNADGSNLFQLTDFRSNNADWSPDGQQIVFQSDHDNEPTDTPDIYVIDANGENLVELVDLPEAIDFNPRWSAQNEILLISSRAGNMEIFTMQADGSAITQVTDAKSPTTNADWSPDGERIAFVYGRNVTDIYHIQKDGAVTSVVRLTADEARDDHPTWSPDGSQIVYTSNKNGNNDLWIVNADGSAPTQLTNDEFDDYYPNWAP